MSPKIPSRRASERRACAPIFAALGDETRLSLLAQLSRGRRRSITQLTRNTRLTRQAVAKHLRVLESARLVRCERAGRESLFEFDPTPMHEAGQYLSAVSAHWDQALSRLKSFVETERPLKAKE